VRRCLALSGALAEWADCHLLVHGEAEVGATARCPVSFVAAAWNESLIALRRLRASALVVDSYSVGAAELQAAGRVTPCVVVIDDAGHFPLPADVVVNAAFGHERPSDPGSTTYLLGPRFALLGPEYTRVGTGRQPGDVRRALVVLGGATRSDLMATIAHVVRRVLPGTIVDLVVGPVGDPVDRVRASVEGLEDVALHVAPPTLRPLMGLADVAITAGGVTLLELAATGVPAIGIELAVNQRANLAGLAEQGGVILVGPAEDPELAKRLETALSALANDPRAREALGRRARALVDGEGAARVSETIRERFRRPDAGRAWAVTSTTTDRLRA
jgi:spore coat polysaccharide biosynthesis predicted glycosyltransferase SpsG